MIKRLPVRELDAGMIAMEPITTPYGQDIAPAGVELTRQIINKMKLYSMDSLLVNFEEVVVPEPEPVAIPTPVVVPMPVAVPMPVVAPAQPQPTPEPQATAPEAPAIDKNTRIEEIKPISQVIVQSEEFMFFQIDYLLVVSTLKESFENVIHNKGYTIDEKLLIDTITPVVTARNTITELFDMIYQMRSIDDSVYSHCVNVALISRMIGRWLHFDANDLNTLTMCGLFHDIGKLAIPEEVLNKPGRLTDEEFALIKTHPKLGYDLLRNQNIDNRIKQSALMHHERYDGSGYPSGLTSELLIDFSMIVAIADVYDAMTAARSYREPLCPFEVISSFERDGLQKYHTKFLLVFLNRIASTYQNNRVLLNDGRACKIVMLNQNYLSKPIVQFDDGNCLDLSTTHDLYIKKVL